MSKITKSANGKECQLRLPGICNWDPSTVVACHIRAAGNAGTGMKPSDIHTVRGCDACHAVIDGRAKSPFTKHELNTYILEAMIRTQTQYLQEGLIHEV